MFHSANRCEQSHLSHWSGARLRCGMSVIIEHRRSRLEGGTMDDQQRRDDGMAQRRKVLGNAWADIWTRPHFDERTRRILVIGTLLSLCQWDEFRLHVRAALTEGGFTPDDIKEIILQQAIYCGVPAANHAVKEASAIIGELGLLKG